VTNTIRRRLFLADRAATQYDQLLASSCRPSVCNAVPLRNYSLTHCALWLSGIGVQG